MWIANPTAKALLLISLVFGAIPEIENPEARVMVVGDIMMHSPVISSGYDYSKGEYDYTPIFSEVEPLFSQADLVIGNLETPLAGKELGYSGYPRFNSPTEIASALKDAGVDVLTTSNNHSMDQWEKGVINTLDNLDELGILHTGTFKSEEEKNKPLIIETNGIKIGLIANTYGTNGLPVPKDKPYLVNMLDMKTIENEVELLKEQDVDYIMAMVHFGYEYHRLPSEEQEKWTEDLFNVGVDFVLGSHSHVVQPLNIIEGKGVDSDKGVIYSMGNFLSNQRWDWKDYGIILDLTLEKDLLTEKITIKELNIIPTYVKISKNGGRLEYKVIPIEENRDDIDETIATNGKELIEHVFQYK